MATCDYDIDHKITEALFAPVLHLSVSYRALCIIKYNHSAEDKTEMVMQQAYSVPSYDMRTYSDL